MTVEKVRTWVELAALGGSSVVFGYGVYSKVQQVPILERRMTVAERKIDFIVGGMEVLTKKKFTPPQELAGQ